MKKKLLFIAVAMAIGSIAAPHLVLAKGTAYKATIDVTGPDRDDGTIRGFVFEDLDRDGVLGRGEPGVPGVMVSNGREVVVTNAFGMYKISKDYYREDMNIFVSKPSCYELPLDENNVPQFAYIHKENGSSKDMLFGSLEPTGELPKLINFPLIHGKCKNEFTLAVSGDPQPYSNVEVGYVRDTLAKELAERDDIEAVLVEGDVIGDDLGLMPRFLNNMKTVGAPQFLVLGNYDVDWDADSDADSSDSFRRIWGPQYYSFTIGKVHFVVLDNGTYPCDGTDPEGNPDDRWSFCNAGKTYTGRISETQLEWLKNDLVHVPADHLIVLNYHIPTVSFIDAASIQHSEDNVVKLYEILGYTWDGSSWSKGRPTVALSGHTHTNDQFRPGELYEGWTQATHDFPMPFPQIIAGAACGSWWSGDFNDEQIPESYQRLGSPKGYFLLSFNGSQYKDEFKAVEAVRTQTGTGEPVLETPDPFALRRQLSVARAALKSTEADENQI